MAAPRQNARVVRASHLVFFFYSSDIYGPGAIREKTRRRPRGTAQP